MDQREHLRQIIAWARKNIPEDRIDEALAETMAELVEKAARRGRDAERERWFAAVRSTRDDLTTTIGRGELLSRDSVDAWLRSIVAEYASSEIGIAPRGEG